MSKHIFILAGSHRQAVNYARANNLWPQHWTFLNNESQLRGTHNPSYIKADGWQNAVNTLSIEKMLKSRNAVECVSVTVLN